MTALKLYVVACLIALSCCTGQECDVKEEEDPLAGINKDNKEREYPREEIKKALEEDSKLKELIEKDAKEQESKAKFLEPQSINVLSTFKSKSELCPSSFVTWKTRGWTYLNYAGKTCWILHYWWTTPLSYVKCPKQKCHNLPCAADNYYCEPTNFKTYIAWSWCKDGGFQYRKFNLPQCCECKKFNCKNT